MLIETMWGMKYIAMDSILEEDVRAQLLVDEMSTIQSNMITYATAFGQIKVMGKISHKLKKDGTQCTSASSAYRKNSSMG